MGSRVTTSEDPGVERFWAELVATWEDIHCRFCGGEVSETMEDTEHGAIEYEKCLRCGRGQ